jgi:hypothetical protein
MFTPKIYEEMGKNTTTGAISGSRSCLCVVVAYYVLLPPDICCWHLLSLKLSVNNKCRKKSSSVRCSHRAPRRLRERGCWPIDQLVRATHAPPWPSRTSVQSNLSSNTVAGWRNCVTCDTLLSVCIARNVLTLKDQTTTSPVPANARARTLPRRSIKQSCCCADAGFCSVGPSETNMLRRGGGRLGRKRAASAFVPLGDTRGHTVVGHLDGRHCKQAISVRKGRNQSAPHRSSQHGHVKK